MKKSRLNLDALAVSSFETDRMAPGQMHSPDIDNPTALSYCEVCPAYTDNC